MKRDNTPTEAARSAFTMLWVAYGIFWLLLILSSLQ